MATAAGSSSRTSGYFSWPRACRHEREGHPGVPMVTGQVAIRAFLERFLAAPGFSLRFHTERVEVSSDAALAYSYGTNTVSFPGPGGSLLHDKGKYVSVYRKEPDGVWKVVADIGNSDLPAPSTEPV